MSKVVHTHGFSSVLAVGRGLWPAPWRVCVSSQHGSWSLPEADPRDKVQAVMPFVTLSGKPQSPAISCWSHRPVMIQCEGDCPGARTLRATLEAGHHRCLPHQMR